MTSTSFIAERMYPELPSTSSATARHTSLQKTDTANPEPSARNASIFLLGVVLKVEVTIAEKDPRSERIWYQIAVKHGSFEWILNKKLTDVLLLDWTLRLYRATSFAKIIRPSEENSTLKTNGLSDISNLAFVMTSKEENLSQHIQIVIGEFLNHILQVEAYKRHPAVLNFFEISGFSFIFSLGEKGKEGFLDKRSSCCLVKNASWNKRWFILKKNFLMYLDSEKKVIEGVFLLDTQCSVAQRNNKIALKNSSHRILLKCPSVYQATVWKISIEENVDEIITNFASHGRAGVASFSPVRKTSAHWFVDGCDYFSAVADALEGAKEEIFISDWFLAPHFYLKRGPELEEKWMLKSLLKKKADEGVDIYVLIYDGPDGFIKLADHFVKTTLENLNKKNISVLRHRGNDLDILWSHHEKLVIVDQRVAFVSGMDLTFGRWDFYEHPLTDLGNDSGETNNSKKMSGKNLLVNGQLWPGVDYANDYVSAEVDFTKPFKDHIDRQKVPRTPWHDIACVTYGEGAQDVARHFIQTWNFVKATKHRKEAGISFLIPNIVSTSTDTDLLQTHASETHVQVLRSASNWATGIREKETSIVEAYVKSIEEAEHYIYIENQFFISYQNQKIVKNGIVSALCRRILRAAAEGNTFRLYVVLPLVPLFEGDFSKADKSQQIQIIADYQYHSISRGEETSLIGSLRNSLTEEQINEYVCFSSLRTHGELNEELITEVLYVHSKLMIVDDRVAIIGSANINDRSLLGDRDSEVVLWIQDTEMINSEMEGRPYQVGKFASGLRRRLFAEHLGLLHESSSYLLSDVVSDEFYHGVWKKIAATNTNVYNKVFRSVPTDEVRRFSKVQSYQDDAIDGAERSGLLRKVNGFLVEFPKQYLEDEDLKRDLLPIGIFT